MAVYDIFKIEGKVLLSVIRGRDKQNRGGEGHDKRRAEHLGFGRRKTFLLIFVG